MQKDLLFYVILILVDLSIILVDLNILSYLH